MKFTIRENLTVIIVAIVVYPAFFGLIGFTVYWTSSMLPLWFLLMTPHLRTRPNDEVEETPEENSRTPPYPTTWFEK